MKGKERLRSIYYGMKQRCYNEKSINYKYYGGRGIRICDEWLESFDNFYQWTIVNGYNNELTIDRIDSNKDYSPDNCKWSTKKEQAYNRSMSVELTLNGRTMYMTEWAEELGIDKKTLSWRYRNGWSDEEILSNKKDIILTYNGESKNLLEWSKKTGIKKSTLWDRYNRGWEVKDILTKNTRDREIRLTYNNEQKTISEWAQILNVPKSRLNNRYSRGWTDEEIIIGKRRN